MEIESHTISVTEKEYKTYHRFSYNDKCLIYLLSCQKYIKNNI